MSTSCTSSASLPSGAGSNGTGLEGAGGGNLYASLDLGSVAARGASAAGPEPVDRRRDVDDDDDDAKDAAGRSGEPAGPSRCSLGGRRNKRKNFQPRNIRTASEGEHPVERRLELTESDSNDGSSRKRSKLADDEDGTSTVSGCSTGDELAACSSGAHQRHQQAVDLSRRPHSASSGCDDEGSLRMNMLLWQRSQLDRLDRFSQQVTPCDLSHAAVRHLIAGLCSLPGREALHGLDPRLPLQELQEVASKASNRPPVSPSAAPDHGTVMSSSRLSEPQSKEATTMSSMSSSSSSGPPLPSVCDALCKQKPTVEGSRLTVEKRPGGSGGIGQSSKNSSPIDYSRYVKRFGSAMECASPQCKDLGHREHFHCVDCQSRVFVKKEEMIRHFKWHKKRDESLQHGFMRYSPGDDCNDRYTGCPHNRKQTHYHCVKTGCDKVYISTSDVQMHANYHRKDSAIIQEGFQRFRATEDCATAHCAFNGQRTTHFHCRRAPCNYTFKNKADMEKHKSYHIKDEQLARDGFKKFMKNEACNYENCRFSRVCNHIHCIRTGCNYVLHSSGQLYSHKRKHERRDAELAYQEGNSSNQMTSSDEAMPALASQVAAPTQLSEVHHPALPAPFVSLPDVSFLMRDPTAAAAALLYGRIPPAILNQLDAVRQKYLEPQKPEQALFTGSSGPAKKFECRSIGCQFKLSEHFHCPYSECKSFNFRSLESVTQHVTNHEKQDKITESYYVSIEEDDESSSCPIDCPHQNRSAHYHCCFDGCQEIVLPSDDPFKRLNHYRAHEKSRQTPVALPLPVTSASPSPQKTAHSQTVSTSVSLDSMFRRKRGRPPKNRVIEVWNESPPAHSGAMPDTPQAIFTSFKLPKPATPPLSHPFNPFGANLSSPLINNHQPTMRPSSPEQPTKRKETVKAVAVQSTVVESSPLLSRSPESPARNLTVVKAAGTFFPSPALPSKHDESNHSNKQESPGSSNEGLDLSQGSVSRPSSSLERADSPVIAAGGDELLVKNSSLTQEDPSFAYGPETSCGRPFCKLKRREHYHCVVCSQAFSEIDKLKPHMLKHCTGALSPSVSHLVNQSAHQNEQDRIKVKNEPGPSATNESSEVIPRSGAALLNFTQPLSSSFGLPFNQPFANSSGFLPAIQSLYATQGFMMNGSPGSSSGRQSSSSPVDQSVAHSDSAKKLRLQSSMRILKDEPVPDGYVRFRFNEDCQYPVCGYREHQTHFHCMRRDCGYSFCDKTRFVQHTARHERLDTLMGGDFQQYRANVNCGRPGCLYTTSIATAQNKASHFHCLKCDFVCTDTNKVVAHRRQHQKTDSIFAAGFEKFTPSQGCPVDACPHSAKQTHYHCLKCSYAVLGLAQMSAHKYRHMENSSTP